MSTDNSIATDQPAHTDHPLRHWDRTCPACNPKGVNVPEPPEQTVDRREALAREVRDALAEFNNDDLPVAKLVAILVVRARGTLANNLCPDHRDKQAGKPCLACRIEQLEAQLQSYVDHQ